MNNNNYYLISIRVVVIKLAPKEKKMILRGYIFERRLGKLRRVLFISNAKNFIKFC